MKFSISREVFAKDLAFAKGAAESKASIPILSNVLLEGSKGAVRLVSTDLDIVLDTKIEAAVDGAEGTTLPVKRLFDIARETQGEALQFETLKNDHVKITAGNAQFKVPGMPATDFPSIPKYGTGKDAVVAECSAQALAEAIDRTRFASTDAESQKYYLSGAHLTIRKGEVQMVATDGHRLAFVVRPSETKGDLTVLVSAKALDELRKLLGAAEVVKISTSGTGQTFQVGRYILSSKGTDAKFPAFEKVVAERKGGAVAKVDREALEGAVRRVRLMAEGVGVLISLRKGEVGVETKSPEGEAKDSVTVAYSGAEKSVGANAGFLLDFLAAAGEAEVEINVGGADEPLRMRPATGDGTYVYVVMPLRLNA